MRDRDRLTYKMWRHRETLGNVDDAGNQRTRAGGDERLARDYPVITFILL